MLSGSLNDKPEPIGRVDDTAVSDPKLVELRFPLLELEFGPIRTTERDVVKPWPQLI